mgnify:CR=1 FL=1
MSFATRLFCKLGLHGPDWLGPEPQHRSQFVQGFVRKCGDCGAVWHGDEVVLHEGTVDAIRTLGDWRRVR